ncbi:DUF4402 domain-containing protein [Oceanicoccus sagamiensis]|uniref:Uncharacterized protein n=1 Tax=Oceanicoccus sagamiensis TaxID=716816 RepID=A0A1X9N601_9GAMM|nr:DUF4402 domain-containing protein [Oceanicoccus sagamiensis]ARN73518.1 hypothetical protein BST96_04925 [Oceanicoccus sagamiensis]
MRVIKTTHAQTRYWLQRAALALLLACCQLAHSQTTPLTIELRDALDFGVISNENGTCSMDNQGNLTGSGGQSCFGTGIRSKFWVWGDVGYSFFVLVSGSTSNGITFNPVIKGNASRTINTNGRRNVRIVGDLVLNNVTPGNFGISYLVSVNYE